MDFRFYDMKHHTQRDSGFMAPRKLFLALLIPALLLGLTAGPILAQEPSPGWPDPARYEWVQVDGRFDNPLYLTHAGDGTGRLFVVEQAGFIWIVQDDVIADYPFLDISDLVTDDTFRGGYSERGLLGLAFHPRFAENGVFFICYIDRGNNSLLVRYRTMPDDPTRADPESAVTLLSVHQPFEDHNGGMLGFGPDGYLYMSLGDGGGGQGDPEGDAQNLLSHLGKILRFDVSDINADAYAIPPDNPFAGREDAHPEIWAYGLRNPWRFSFDRLTGDLYIADVGWGTIEEIDFQPADSPGGENYGWAVFEGTLRINPELEPPADVVWPAFEYDHSYGCSVTGGYVYRGEAMSELQGRYIFGDYCNGRMWTMQRDASGAWRAEVFMETGRQISSFGEDEQGELYLVDYKGFVLRLQPASPNEGASG
jgi:glucose/arabinose dehydrogenase